MPVVPVEFATQVSSTLHLGSIPKLDKTRFISSFVDTQRLHTKYYAEEGRTLWNNLVDTARDPSPKNPPQENTVFGLSTPVLVPRIAKVIIAKEPVSKTSTPKENSPKKSKSKAKSTFRAKSGQRPNEHPQNAPHTKKRAGKLSDDDETAARLAERRDKKRAKREIVRPAATANEKDSKQIQIQAATDKKGKQNKGPPGLALMHGFTATNVGKNRLTVPPPTLGVFSRGRASHKTHINTKAIRPPAFLETVFLKGTSHHAKSVPNEPLSDGSSSSQNDSTPTTPPKLKTRKVRSPSVKNHSQSSTVSSSSFDNEGTETPIAQAESEVWDIEREGYNLPSTMSSTSPERNQSVVLNTCNLPRVLETETSGGMHERHKREALAHERDGTSQLSSSLAPSQSASQHGLDGRCRATTPVPLLASKYFMPQRPYSVPDALAKTLSSPSTLALQGTHIQTHESSVSDYFLHLPVAPNMHANTSYHPPHQADEFIYEPYIAPIYAGESLWDPLAFSDPVNFSDTDAPQPPPETVAPNLTSGISYPYDFYIPPRVDAPPLQYDLGYDVEDANSMFYLDDDGCGHIGCWGPQEIICDNHEEEYPEHGQIYDEHEHLFCQTQQFGAEDESTTAQNWQRDLCSIEDDALFGMGIDSEEADMLQCPSEEWMEPIDRDRVLSDVNSDDSVVGEMPRFLQGRELLLGFGTTGRQEDIVRDWSGYASVAEADVARNLKGHWLPQRL
ncbi:hypothetical protein F5876DRAFT_75347 [Lentinula aff. lateritia]|uniref:Uncharacterized protein n=1 Tax=Lentinula aff. lateritia TaxID=2804960 RepID=A0ACC1U4E3_9AGAR|nr:hypothetical protein F5876DRAFT_75347 [Lentinula aff. lateritia]